MFLIFDEINDIWDAGCAMKINPPEIFLSVHLMCALYTSFPARKVICWHTNYKLNKRVDMWEADSFFPLHKYLQN